MVICCCFFPASKCPTYPPDIDKLDEGEWEEDNSLRISESPPDTPKGCISKRDQLPSLCNSSSDQSIELTDLVLPKSQPPTVTLLQKSRAGEIPKGALYVGTSERIEGGYKHAEQFFLVPAFNQISKQDKQDTVCKTEPGLVESQELDKSKSSQQESQRESSQSECHQGRPDTNNNAVAPASLVVDKEFNQRTNMEKKVKPPVKKKPIICKLSLHTSSSKSLRSTQANSDAKDTVMVADTLADISQSAASPHSQYLTALSIDEEENGENPFITGDSQSTSRSCSVASSASLCSPSLQYKEIQRGGEIPFSGLRKPAPVTPPRADKPKQVPAPVAGYDRSPAPLPRVQRDRSDARRREILSKIETEERRKKAKEEEAARKARRHSDYFSPKEKSPIPHNRYDGPVIASMSAPQSPARSTTSQNSPRVIVSEMNKPCTAIALYEFIAQHPREMSVRKDETVSIKRRVDGNWYEVCKNGRNGIIPVTYLQVVKEFSLTPPPLISPPPDIREGSAVARYNFNPQSEAELALRRGDRVSLIKRVDPNWYKGRVQGSITTGIFPVSYLQVISEPVLEDNNYWLTDQINSPMSALINRSQSVPTGTSHVNIFSQKISSPPEYKPMFGYSQADQTSNYNNNNNNNNDWGFDKNNEETISTDVNRDICSVGETECGIKQRRRSLDMPSYRSLYNYEPQNEDELQLKRGDIVHVIEKCTDGWFVGTSGRTGLFGTFPGNYVTPV
ncbi:sorbin and SH3 domain-containing protein 1-like [Watersipora subatra]|uniref:sorbin and SH3 domain-containing protein 1-like n=1 Tax=Watersipora subatra TaxID=2589382 RepID=UPI00355B3ED1